MVEPAGEIEASSTNNFYVEIASLSDNSNKPLLCCKSHPEYCAKMVALVGIALSPVWAFYTGLNMIFYEPEHSTLAIWLSTISCCIAIISYSCIFMAVNARKRWLYLPFLVYNAYSIIARLVYSGFMIFALCSDEIWAKIKRDHEKNQNSLVLMIVFCLIINLLKIFLNIWFELIIMCAYRYAKFNHRGFQRQVDDE
ncbi:hypothetical protein Ddc_11340 [Ditylenchus destructor]|nr:hypothetical protein Ddc_11340 [Ditylenchus destructor]